MVYYLYRFYDPNLQRWLNRDPIGEQGGVNLYGYVGNDASDFIDLFGLFPPAAGVLAGAGSSTEAAGSVGAVTTSLSYGGGTAASTFTVTAGGGATTIGLGTALGFVVAVPAAVGFVGADVYQMVQINSLNQQNQQVLQLIQLTQQQLKQKSQERKAYKARCGEKEPSGLDPCELAKWKLQRQEDCYLMRYNFGLKWYNDGFARHEGEMRNLLQSIENAEEEVRKNCQPCPKK